MKLSKAKMLFILADNAKVMAKISKQRSIELWMIRKYIKNLAKA